MSKKAHHRLFVTNTILAAIACTLGACSKTDTSTKVVSADDPAAATRRLLILPPQVSPLDDAAPPAADKDEIARFMQRQAMMLISDAVMDKTLMTDQVRSTSWYKENFRSPKAALRAAVTITLEPSSDTIKVSMKCTVPSESAIILNCVTDEYIQQLTIERTIRMASEHRTLSDAEAKMHAMVDQAVEEMKSFRMNNKLDAILRGDVAAELAAVNQEAAHSQKQLSLAKAIFEKLQQGVQNGTLQLSPEKEREIANDGLPRTIESKQMELTLERDVLLATKPAEDPAVKELTLRLDSLKRQAAEREETLRSKARVAMQEEARINCDSATLSCDLAMKQKQQKEVEVHDLDRKYVIYQQMEQNLQELTRTLHAFEAKNRIVQFSESADLSRVRAVGGAAQTPSQ